jgi:molybdopterin-guanine dinucleotide biosynthesis protein B
VAFASARQLVLTRSLDQEVDVNEIAAMLGTVDIVLTEGYKRAHKPKIEVSRRELGTDLVCRPEEIIAVVSDHELDTDAPRYGLDDASQVADLLIARFLS